MKTKEEIEILRADALSGDSRAQNDIGCAYSSGDGVQKDLKEAFKWFELSAKQGNFYGQYNLGLHYHFGLGVQKNIRKAIEYYEKSALQHYSKAANKLGEIYEKGYKSNFTDTIIKKESDITIKADPEEAFYWYYKGRKDEQSRYNLARCYELGIGTPICLYRAYNLYIGCNTAEARKRLDNLRKTYNPLIDSRLETVDIFCNNPFRLLGVFSNATEREIRANKTKIEVSAKVGKAIFLKTDSLFPSNFEDNIALLKNDITFERERVGAPLSSRTAYKITVTQEMSDRAISRLESSIHEWSLYKDKLQNWKIQPNRSIENIESASQKLASDIERIKYALFWFCNFTSFDEEALKLLSEHKYSKAKDIWDKTNNFSAHINRAVLKWIERKDYWAIIEILNLIHSDENRSEFVSIVSSGRLELSKEELSKIFWDSIYDFSETELTLYDIHRIITDPYDATLKLILERNEYDINYNLKKIFEILKAPLENLLLLAEAQNPKDWGKCSSAYYNAADITKKTIKKLQRFLGDKNLHYKLFCNEAALKFLDFAIRYNNDNKEDWNAPSTAFYFADLAQSIAVDETLRERCHKNVEIFDNNKRIVQTQKACESIDKMFEELEGEQVSLYQVERNLRSFLLHNEIIESKGIVNIILNIVIKIYNKDKDPQIATSAEKILKELQKVAMKPETQNRLNQNIEILSKNKKYTSYSVNSDYCNTENRISARKALKDINKRFRHMYRHTYTPDEIKYRRIHKSIVTVVSVIVIALFLSILLWVYDEQWFSVTGIVIISFIVLFLIIMWILELLPDPHNPDFEWFEDTNIKLDCIANEITYAGASGGRTYSWPFAIPFQLLAILIGLIGLIINGLAKLAAKIK